LRKKKTSLSISNNVSDANQSKNALEKKALSDGIFKKFRVRPDFESDEESNMNQMMGPIGSNNHHSTENNTGGLKKNKVSMTA
jgi:hypothetical protein